MLFIAHPAAPPTPFQQAIGAISVRQELSPGDRLAFDLRVNATASRKTGVGADGRAERQRVDVAIDRLHAEEARGATAATRAIRREPAARAAADEWLKARETRDGYRLAELKLVGYRVETLPRDTGRSPASASSICKVY